MTKMTIKLGTTHELSRARSLVSCGVALLWLAGCATWRPIQPAEDVRDQGSVHTLSYFVGRDNPGLHDKNFAAGAKKVCAGNPYKVLEQAAVPSTLRQIDALIPPENFYWVIRCVRGDAAH